jgi:hypothetical protein
MKTFEIQYVSRCRDYKEHCLETIEAQSTDSALKKFAKQFKIKDYKQLFDESFRWWENDEWLNSFRNIREVNEINCPHCNGTGKITIEKGNKCR